jgi:hypothetical protein
MAELPLKTYFDIENNILRDSAGTEITSLTLLPSIRLSQKFRYNVQLVSDSALTAYDKLEASSSAYVLVDNDYSNAPPIIEIPGSTTIDYWTLSSGAEYYFNRSDITAKPDEVYFNSVLVVEGTVGSLSAGEWGWDVINTRLVVRLADDTDPDTKGDGWVTYKPTASSYTHPFIEADSATFNEAGSWWDEISLVWRNPDITAGEMTIELSARGSSFYSRLGTAKQKIDTVIQWQIVNGSANIYALIEFQMLCRNRFVGDEWRAEIVGVNYYTKAEADALYVRKLLSTNYPIKATLAGTEEVYLLDGSTPKYTTAQAIGNLGGAVTKVSISASYNISTALPGIRNVQVYCDASAGAFSVTLPSASAIDFIEIIKIDSSANAITIIGTVNGVSNPTIATQYGRMEIISNNTTIYSTTEVTP